MREEEIINEINIIKETLIDVLDYDLKTYKEVNPEDVKRYRLEDE